MWVAGEGLCGRCEDTYLARVRRIGGRQHEGGLGVAELARDALHLVVRQPGCLRQHGERIAAEPLLREHIAGVADQRMDRCPSWRSYQERCAAARSAIQVKAALELGGPQDLGLGDRKRLITPPTRQSETHRVVPRPRGSVAVAAPVVVPRQIAGRIEGRSCGAAGGLGGPGRMVMRTVRLTGCSSGTNNAGCAGPHGQSEGQAVRPCRRPGSPRSRTRRRPPPAAPGP